MPYTFKQFKAEYPDDAACLDKILEIQYGGHEFDCPGCGAPSRFHRIAKRRAYACQSCGHHVYPCVRTPFEKSRTPLTGWFFAMYLMTSTRHGVAAKELQRQIGCTYKTAWRMAHELHKLMASADYQGPLSGTIEADETFIGGRQRGRKHKNENKTVVFGMVERDGNVRAGPIPNIRKPTIQRAVLTNVQRGRMLFTDELRSYNSLRKDGPHRHFNVNHSIGQYVNGPIHTNTIEGYWSRLKNSIRGTHIRVSKQHLWKYVSEFSFRYNMRKSPEIMFDRLVAAFALPRLADD